MHSIVSEQGLFFMGHKYFTLFQNINIWQFNHKGSIYHQNPHILNHNFQKKKIILIVLLFMINKKIPNPNNINRSL